MRVIADLQVHSKYARATSKDLSIENLEKYGRIKGLDLIGTGDFQHPLHRKEIDAALTEDDKGILRTKTGFPFLWQTEVSLMFSQGGKRRAVHLLIFAPNTKMADKITDYLGSKGRLDYDGRPIFGITCRDLVRDLKKIDDKIEIIPAHCMTPYFGVFGSKSGFDSLQECFLDMTDKIYAVESGLSADPGMLWRFKENINIVSFSDAHSFWPFRLGREATLFDIPELSYENIIGAIRTGNGLWGTIETPPSYGKYHWDGHRDCNFSSSPEETKKLKGICPVCHKPLIIGVDYRVEEIAKGPAGYRPKNAKMYYDLVPLQELISFVYKTPMAGKKCWEIYNGLIDRFGNELKIMTDVERNELARADPKLVDIIIVNREGKLKIKPGYDGVYGQIEESSKSKKEEGQKHL
ncbi:MAG: DNA helicase UvrD [Candidatus Micrarchaeota archaeon]|nr:DNA helicase UvrD [Candidatus Micrarchaeota archaeon]